MLQPLDAGVRSRLRSGVSITSVSQCVDELLLNSIDAGSTCVAVRVDLSSCRVQVIDNGCGLDKDQLESVAERYCTSKCHTVEDLENLVHFGYRGEALASMRDISAIVEIESRSKNSTLTYCRIFHNGKPLPVTQCKVHRPSSGTTVTIHDLFSALPVRKKSMNPALELERIRQRVEAIAIVRPGISLSLRNETTGAKLLQTHKSSSVLGAFTHLFGTSKSRHLCEVAGTEGVFRIHGYISKEGHYNKSLQFIYVNDRLVLKTCLHKTMHYMLGKSLIIKRKAGTPRTPVSDGSPVNSPPRLADRHGIFVLNITCPLSDYDITFDPAKTLVEFNNWQTLQKCIQDMVGDFLKRENLSLSLDLKDNSGNAADVQIIPDEDVSSQEDLASASQDSDCAESQEILSDETNLKKYGKAISTVNMLVNLQSKTAKRIKKAYDNTSVDDPECVQQIEDGSITVDRVEPSTVPETQLEGEPNQCIMDTAPGELLSLAVPDSQDNDTEKPSSSRTSMNECFITAVTACNTQSPLYQSSEDPIEKASSSDLDNTMNYKVLETQLMPACDANKMKKNDTCNISICRSFDNPSLTVSQLLRSDFENQSGVEVDNSDIGQGQSNQRDRTFISLASTAATPLSSLESFKQAFQPLTCNTSGSLKQSDIPRSSGNSHDFVQFPRGLSPLIKLKQKFQRKSPRDTTAQCSSSLTRFQHDMQDESVKQNLLSSLDKIRRRLESKRTCETPSCNNNANIWGASCSTKHILSTAASNVSETEKMVSDEETDLSSYTKIDDINKDSHNEREQTRNANSVTEHIHLPKKRILDEVGDNKSDANPVVPLASKLAKLSRRAKNVDRIASECNIDSSSTSLFDPVAHNSRVSVSTDYVLEGASAQSMKQPCCEKQPTNVCSSSQSKTGRTFLTSDQMFQTITDSVGTRYNTSNQESLENAHSIFWSFTDQQCVPDQSPRSIVTNPGKSVESSETKLPTVIDVGSFTIKTCDQKVKKKTDLDAHDQALKQHLKTPENDISRDSVFTEFGHKPLESMAHHNDQDEEMLDTFRSQLFSRPYNLISTPSLAVSTPKSDNQLLKSANVSQLEQSRHNVDDESNKTGHYMAKRNTLVKSTNELTELVSGIAVQNVCLNLQNPNHPTCESPISHNISSVVDSTDKDKQVLDQQSSRFISTDQDMVEFDQESSRSYSTDKNTLEINQQPSIFESKDKDLLEINQQSSRLVSKDKDIMESNQQPSRFVSTDKDILEINQQSSRFVSKDKDVLDNNQQSSKFAPMAKDTESKEEPIFTTEYSDYTVEFTTLKDLNISGMEWSSQSSMSLIASDNEENQSEKQGNRTPSSDISMHSLGFSTSVDEAPVSFDQSQGFPFAQDSSQINQTQSFKVDVKKSQCLIAESQGFLSDKVEELSQHTLRANSPTLSKPDPTSEESPPLMHKLGDMTPAPGEIVIDTASKNKESTFLLCHLPRVDTGKDLPEPIKQPDESGNNGPSSTMVSSQTFRNCGTEDESLGFAMDKPESQTFSVGVNHPCQNDSGIVQDITSEQEFSLQKHKTVSQSSPVTTVNHDNSENDLQETSLESNGHRIPSTSAESVSKTEVAPVEHSQDEKVVFVGTSWICKLDSSGRKLFVNRITGNTSYENPMGNDAGDKKINPPSFTVTRANSLLDHAIPTSLLQSGRGTRQVRGGKVLSPSFGASLSDMWSQYQENQDTEDSVKWRDGQYPQSLIQGLNSSKEIEELFEKWDNPSFTQPEKEVMNVDASCSSRCSSIVQKAIHPHKFTKDVFKTIQVLGQVDNKFIACLATLEKKNCPTGCKMLIVVDQHAAHERVRLENLSEEAYDSNGTHIKCATVTPAVDMAVSEEDVRVMKAYRTGMEKIGVTFSLDVTKRETVRIHSIPACFTEREASERKRKRSSVAMDMLETLIKEQVELLKATNGAAATMPKTISALLNSQACHGAIKFGDPLSHAECEQLIQELSKCKLPFQCAHGRPSLMPVLDLEDFSFQFPPEITRKPSLWKLRQRMLEEEPRQDADMEND